MDPLEREVYKYLQERGTVLPFLESYRVPNIFKVLKLPLPDLFFTLISHQHRQRSISCSDGSKAMFFRDSLS
jgi:hypothetical protein